MDISNSQNIKESKAELAFAELVNIGPEERRKRQIFGFMMLGVAAVMLYLFISLGINHWWGVFLWIPLFLGAIGILQCYHHT
ncbi:hypothetical protein ACFL6E_07385 [Candidatus Neomarinimicrobiota bacterium]